ncbi:hypothetical protein [Luteolibacter sp. Populi]|uniref:hypothetical protein n=1 Tax=Luteolibacter sp. Populi TaxID=3230487 RepID=UPI0034655ADD
MKPAEFLLSMVLCAAGFAGGYFLKDRLPRSAEDSRGAEAGIGAAKSGHRDEINFGSVQAYLRAGDLDGARAELARLAKRDPIAFFKLLERLPGMPGIEDSIRVAAAGLPWKDSAVIELLNRIAANGWRDLAWNSYTGARSGVLPDQEVFEIGIKARTYTSCSGIRKLMQDAAKDRPESFFALMNKQGGTTMREEFVTEAMKHDPAMGAKLFASIPDGSSGCNYDRAYVLQARARCFPTADNLMATMHDIGGRGIYSGDFGALFASQAYENGTPEERIKILDQIAALPPLARNRMLDGPTSFVKGISLGEFSRAVGLSTSGFYQERALDSWMKGQPDLDQGDRGWIASLPTEKLRAKAGTILDERAAQKAAK